MNLSKNLLDRLMVALVAVVAIVLFRYLGSFTIPASILLGVSFTIVAMWLYALWKITTFQPYSVEVFVNFDVLCGDLDLPRAPMDSDNAVYEIYKFTALTASVFAHYDTLIVKTSEQMGTASVRSETDYRTSIIFGNRVPCVLMPEPVNNPENRNLMPYFFFRPGHNGYSFGIRIVENWWFEHRKKLGAQMCNAPVDPNGEIVLCVLPYGYIPDHVRRWESTDLFGLFDLKQRRWNARLSKQGWKVSEIDPGRVEHRYVNITYNMLFG